MHKEDIKSIISVIKEWMSAADNENSYFARYALEFFAFNSLLRLNFNNGGKREQERTLIERCKCFLCCNEFQIDEKTKKDVEEIMKTTKEYPLINLTRNNRTIRIKNEKDWQNIIETVYVIRNNLFHGSKQYSRERDNNLVKAAYPILSWLNEILIKRLESRYEKENT